MHTPDTELQAGTIQLPGDFFVKEKLSYNDFKLAWAREALQNSRDAGAKNIDFTIKQDYDTKKLLVVCDDDGKGMNQDVLLNVFLKMGGSQKEDGNTGGFGYAKVLLAFAHLNYKIKTQNLEVVGTAANYGWKEVSDVRKGVRLEVEMTTEDNSAWSMEEALRELVSASNLGKDIKVTLNGETLTARKTPQPYKLETALGHLTFGDYESTYSSTSTIWVRMNGLAMFKSRLWTDGAAFHGALELKGHSLEMLTSNRDALSKDKTEILNKIMQDLANDREKLKLSGDIDLTLNELAVTFESLTKEEQDEVMQQAASHNMTASSVMEQLNALADEISSLDAMHPFTGLLGKVKDIKSKLDDKISKIPSQWYPPNFKVKFADSGTRMEDAHTHSSQIASSMSLQRNAKIAAGWSKMMCVLLENEGYRTALGIKIDAKGQFFHDDLLIQPGFVYGSVVGLNAKDTKNNRISIMLNPEIVRKDGFKIPDIIDVLHHELNHVMHPHHGESFTIGEFKLRRIMRDQIGELTLVKAFKKAAADVDFTIPAPQVEEKLRASARREHNEYQGELSI